MMEKLFEIFAKTITAIVLIVLVISAASLILAFPVKWCWNAVIPDVFRLPEIGYWEAFCLVYPPICATRANLSINTFFDPPDENMSGRMIE